MESMTPEQREKFIEQRVQDILKAFENFHTDLGQLSLEERDRFIQNRAVRDLAISDALRLRFKRYVAVRDSTWMWITFTDVLVLITLAGLTIRDMKDIVAIVIIAIVFGVSRLINQRLLSQLHELLKLYEAHDYHESDTAALLFLINGIDIIEKVKGVGDKQ